MPLGVVAGPAALSRGPLLLDLCLQSFNSSASHAESLRQRASLKRLLGTRRRSGNSLVIGGRLWQDRQERLSNVSSC